MTQVYGTLQRGPVDGREFIARFVIESARVPAKGEELRIGVRASKPQPYIVATVNKVTWHLDGETLYLELLTRLSVDQALDILEPMAEVDPTAWPRIASRAKPETGAAPSEAHA